MSEQDRVTRSRSCEEYLVEGIISSHTGMMDDFVSQVNFYLTAVNEQFSGLNWTAEVVSLWNSDDWQVHMTGWLLILLVSNIVLIALAWSIYGKTICEMLNRKARSPISSTGNMSTNLASNPSMADWSYLKKNQ